MEAGLDHKLTSLYEWREDDGSPFLVIKAYLRCPAKFQPGEWTLIAELPKKVADWRNVRLFESRHPARFFKVVVLPDADHQGIEYETGSGLSMACLAAEIARSHHQNLRLAENDLSRRMMLAEENGMLARKVVPPHAV